MREIKFRARNAGVPSCWIYGYFVIEKDICYIVNDDGKFQVIAGTEGQYTGLWDGDTKEIYEGESVQYWKGAERDNQIPELQKGVIAWQVYKWVIEEIKTCEVYDLGDFGEEDLEIIYENPELLEDKDA